MHPVIRLGTLLLHLNGVEGRKKFQKLVYILQAAGAPFPERFELSLFGAYSSELKAELDAMKAEQLLDEVFSAGWIYPFYTLKPGAALRPLFEELEIKETGTWLSLAERLNRESASTLEGVSTILYLRQRNWQDTSLKERFVALKPHLAARYDDLYRQSVEIPLPPSSTPVSTAVFKILIIRAEGVGRLRR